MWVHVLPPSRPLALALSVAPPRKGRATRQKCFVPALPAVGLCRYRQGRNTPAGLTQLQSAESVQALQPGAFAAAGDRYSPGDWPAPPAHASFGAPRVWLSVRGSARPLTV